MTYAIQAEGLVKHYGDTVALDGVDLQARAGSVLGVLGPNGAGKTTAVRILATLLRPDAGRATVDGHDVVRDAHQVRQLIGLTGQYASVDEMLTGTENLVMTGRLLEMPRREAKARAAELLERFELWDARDRAAKTSRWSCSTSASSRSCSCCSSRTSSAARWPVGTRSPTCSTRCPASSRRTRCSPRSTPGSA